MTMPAQIHHDSNLPALMMDEQELMSVLRNSLYPGASDDSIKLVKSYCQAASLDLMTKPVHIVPMWDNAARMMRDVIMPGIGLYRTQAARSGEYAGVSEPEFGPDVTELIGGVEVTYPKWCKVTVKRLVAGREVCFTAMEFWKENYAVKGGKERSIAPNAMWLKRPYGQLAKCTEAQGLRKAFPEFGAMPTADEMEGKELYAGGHTIDASTGHVTPPAAAATVAPDPDTYPADRFAANFPKWQALIRNGQRTADEIIATVGSKNKLSDEQRAAILNITPEEVSA